MHRIDAESETLIAHTLRADGFDASEDGTGRGTPLVPIPILEPGSRTGKSTTDPRAGMGVGEPGDPMYTLQGGRQHAVGFDANDSGNDAGEGIAPTLRSMDGGGGNYPAVAFQKAQVGCREYDTAGALRADGPGHDPVGTRVREGMAVRRLTPRECERLQGFPDDYTLVPYRGKPMADSPRYRMLGNSWAVPCARWIGERIAMVDRIVEDA